MDDYVEAPGGDAGTGNRAAPRVRRRAGGIVEQSAPQEPKEVDLRALAQTIWRRKLAIAACGFVFGLLGIALVYSLTPRYQSTAVVMMEGGEEQIIDLESVAAGFSADFFSIRAETEVLQSRALVGRVVDALDLTQHPYFNPALDSSEPPWLIQVSESLVDFVKASVRGLVSDDNPPGRGTRSEAYWERQRAIDILLRDLTISSVNDTYVYSVTVENEDPALAADIANKMAELYIVDQLESKFEATEAATEWLSNRVVELKQELEASEARVEAYNSSTSLVSEQALGGMSRQLKELRERREDLAETQAAAEARAARLSAALESGNWAAAAEIADRARLRSLAGDIAATEDPAEAERLRERLSLLSRQRLAQLETQAARAGDQLAAVRRSISDLEIQLESQTEDLVELRQLQREAEADRRIYEQFLRRLNETSVQQGVQQADARVLSSAVVSIYPVFPKKTITVLSFGVLGGLIGIGLVLFIEHANNAFRSSEELETSTGLPVLGAMPVVPVRNRRALLDYAISRSSSSLMEAVRNLRTGILLANVDSTPKVVMLTSSLPKEGKTTTSLLLAQNASQLNKRVLLIECDLRRRTFRSYFSGAPDHGLMSILTGERSLENGVFHDESTGLDVILGEESKVNAADVFASRRFEEFMEQARARYDFVVVDTPPVLAVPDARVIAPMVDAILYCVRWNSTPRELVRDGVNQFTQIGVHVAGLAMTQVNTRKMARYGYGGYNYSYYRQSGRYYDN